MKILFITATRIGDAVLSTGLLGRMLDDHTDARITVVCGPAAASLFRGMPGLEKLVVLEKRAFSLHWPMLFASCATTWWDVVIDLRRSPMSYLPLATRRYVMGRPIDGEHRVQQLARVLGLEDDPPSPRLWQTDETIAEAARLIPDGTSVLAVGPAANWRAKTWRAENFVELINRLTAADGILPGARVAVFGHESERGVAQPVIEAISEDRCIDLVGGVDLDVAFACLKRSAFYVGNDSGLMHIASAAGIPTLGLFGPTQEQLYAPWAAQCDFVRTTTDFLDLFPADFDHTTSDSLMDTLTVDMAEDAANALWHRMGEVLA